MYMKKMRYSKTSLVTISIIALIILLAPSVLAGSFQLVVYPPETPIKPGVEMKHVEGFVQNSPGAIDNLPLLPPLWFYQYTNIEVAEKPEWATVAIPESTPMTPPDGQKYDLTIIVAVTEDAPAYEFGTVKLSISTGKFMRTIFPSWFPMTNEFNMDQSFVIRSGYLPLLTATNPPAKEGTPNTNINHVLHLVNTGNARSLIEFSVDYNAIPEGWSIAAPASIYINKGESIDVPVDIYSPRTLGYTDEWAQIPIKMNMRSVVEPTGESANFTVTVSTHCVGYYAPVPGGNNPAMLFGSIIGIIILIIVIIIVTVKMIRKSSFTTKLKLPRRKKEE